MEERKNVLMLVGDLFFLVWYIYYSNTSNYIDKSYMLLQHDSKCSDRSF